ncbi:MAG: hypothetical protein NC218_03570 [Acetobacter sp.]|nr:hypothetical protein [Acetobacter sp.]
MDKTKVAKAVMILVGLLLIVGGVVWGFSILMDELIDTACERSPLTSECIERLMERGKL